ncbi:hypothetical protein [Mammaliicoccus sciuri]|uniref:hypothetical protein n=1 Tax=Mammaliicoccus sciuri TaxID=1296 RepID=UPI000B09DE7B|nr:hypothetical protein [Mammaliicoccus sciuri]MEB8265540.1 hypothetical protein [Mammaliicoccus sciuri]
MQTGNIKCDNCNIQLYVKEVRYLYQDTAYKVGCPNCNKTLQTVANGTIDYICTVVKA